jgi:hypothetical protein
MLFPVLPPVPGSFSFDFLIYFVGLLVSFFGFLARFVVSLLRYLTSGRPRPRLAERIWVGVMLVVEYVSELCRRLLGHPS